MRVMVIMVLMVMIVVMIMRKVILDISWVGDLEEEEYDD